MKPAQRHVLFSSLIRARPNGALESKSKSEDEIGLHVADASQRSFHHRSHTRGPWDRP